MLNSVDLFSGIGGFALSLKDIAAPLLYCDNDLHVSNILKQRFLDCQLPQAPIVNDVRDIKNIKTVVNGRHVHILTAGFPCVGFSGNGTKQGLQNKQSTLFHAASDVIEDLRPDMVLFENVMGILSHTEDFEFILSRMNYLGYSMRWTVLSASDVGACQLRNRWYCLATRFDSSVVNIILKDSITFPNFPTFPVISRNPADKKLFAHRFRALGNSVVPLAARLAFCRLFTGFTVCTIEDLCSRDCLKFENVRGTKAYQPCRHGLSNFTNNGVEYRSVAVPSIKKIKTIIHIDPRNYSPREGWVKRVQKSESKPISEKTERNGWPTPRVSAAQHSHVLTTRTICDLSTFALFVTRVDDFDQRKTKSGDSMDARFVEWIMGYPEDWTKI